MDTLQHLGVIMDGNRRWAKSNKISPHKGHDRGSDVFADICDLCLEYNIPYLTVYAFSTENWTRTPLEIKHIFRLLEKFFAEKKESCIEKSIKVKIIGERTRFYKRTLSIIRELETDTQNCTKLNLQIALSYGGRDEIIRAVKQLTNDALEKKVSVNDITEDVFSSYLDTAGIPDVDLVIRTGGAENKRLSNFLPWQTVYAELYFSDLLWPEFSAAEFERAVDYYNSVKKKLGK
ncbi:MAG: polyprenyl diphosphate synthase [Oscillospiraceae bacterium]|nr:polyprenyl diphosphate synthase [Oscillospiraceae bacterium]